MARGQNLTRDERKRQIQIAFALEVQHGNEPEMTVADIARKLHLTPSTFLRDIIMELVIDGSLDFRDQEIPGKCKFRRLYSPNYEVFKKPKAEYGRQGRAIKVNAGQQSFLMEMGE